MRPVCIGELFGEGGYSLLYLLTVSKAVAPVNEPTVLVARLKMRWTTVTWRPLMGGKLTLHAAHKWGTSFQEASVPPTTSELARKSS